MGKTLLMWTHNAVAGLTIISYGKDNQPDDSYNENQ